MSSVLCGRCGERDAETQVIFVGSATFLSLTLEVLGIDPARWLPAALNQDEMIEGARKRFDIPAEKRADIAGITNVPVCGQCIADIEMTPGQVHVESGFEQFARQALKSRGLIEDGDS